MSVVVLARVALGLLALVAARRARGPRGAALAGVAGAAAVLGPAPASLPGPSALGAALLGAALLLALLRAGLHSPLVSEAASFTLALAAGAAVPTLAALRGAERTDALAGAGAVFAALSLWGAEGCRAAAETGWRRGASWASAVVLPALAASGVGALAQALPPRLGGVAPAAALLGAALAWAGPALLERGRVRRELLEESRLGILPEEDLAVLGSPWRRVREARFGRADERREYVRSALLLAIARQQQRRRSGEAIRLRQLEVLSFRTRVRRAVEGRASRHPSAADESAF